MPDKEYIQRLADERYTGEIRNRFEEALEQVSDGIVLEKVARRIEDGDWEGALEAIGLTVAAFEGVREATQGAAAAGGRETLKQVGIAVDFDPGAPRAQRRVDELHTDYIREVTDETRAAIRDEIEQGLSRGENPRDTARRIRGTWDKQAGKHRGGVIGLTRHQASVVRYAREQLEEASELMRAYQQTGDTDALYAGREQYRRYLGRKLRDRRHDSSVLKAIDEGRPLTKDQIERFETSYRRRWTNYRAETIARDQSLEALSMGQEEAMDQAVEAGEVAEEEIVKEWVVTRDGREREAHAAIPSRNAGGVPRDEMFDTMHGDLRRPRDRNSPGSVAENVIQCRCSMFMRVRR